MPTSLATLSDFQSIKDLMEIALKQDPLAFSVSAEEYTFNSLDWWHRYIDPFLIGFTQQMVVYKEDDKVVGMIGMIYDFKERKRHVGSIVWFYVHPDYRGKGYGSDLIKYLLDLIKKNKAIKKLSLLVNESQSQAKKVYEKSGFTLSGSLRKDLKIDQTFYDVHIMELLLD